MFAAEIAETASERMARLSGQSREEDTLIVELVYRGQFVQFDISTTELAHLDRAALYARYFERAFADVQAPAYQAG